MKNKLNIIILSGIIIGLAIGTPWVFAQPQPTVPDVGGGCQIDTSTGKCAEKKPAAKPPAAPTTPQQPTTQQQVNPPAPQQGQGWWFSYWIKKYWEQWKENAGKAIKHLGESWAEFYWRLSQQKPKPSQPKGSQTSPTPATQQGLQHPPGGLPPESEWQHVPRGPSPECYDPLGGGLIPGCQ